jgi:hypothetical protein
MRVNKKIPKKVVPLKRRGNKVTSKPIKRGMYNHSMYNNNNNGVKFSNNGVKFVNGNSNNGVKFVNRNSNNMNRTNNNYQMPIPYEPNRDKKYYDGKINPCLCMDGGSCCGGDQFCADGFDCMYDKFIYPPVGITGPVWCNSQCVVSDNDPSGSRGCIGDDVCHNPWPLQGLYPGENIYLGYGTYGY